MNEIYKGMDNAAEQINENFIKTQEKTDTGWIDIPLNNVDGGSLFARAVNGVVFLTGTFSKNGEIRSEINIGKIPVGLEPDMFRRVSGAATPDTTSYPEQHAAILNIHTDGKVELSKKSATTTFYFETSYPVSE